MARRRDQMGPLRWIGGKFYLADWHVGRFPDHELFVSPFMGGASEIFAKPLGNEVVNDNDGEVVNFWNVVRDHTEEFVGLCTMTPLSREFALHLEGQRFQDPVRRAWRFFMLNRQCFSGTKTGDKVRFQWTISTRSRRGINETASSLLSAVDRLPEVADRWRAVVIENLDFEECIAKYDGEGTFHYIDPPYFLGGTNTYYATAFTVDDHRRLAKRLRNIRGKALVCGVPSPLYDDLFGDWQRETLTATVHSSGSAEKETVEETIWTNYPLTRRGS